jgi:hypothetical protein
VNDEQFNKIMERIAAAERETHSHLFFVFCVLGTALGMVLLFLFLK